MPIGSCRYRFTTNFSSINGHPLKDSWKPIICPTRSNTRTPPPIPPLSLTIISLLFFHIYYWRRKTPLCTFCTSFFHVGSIYGQSHHLIYENSVIRTYIHSHAGRTPLRTSSVFAFIASKSSVSQQISQFYNQQRDLCILQGQCRYKPW